MGRYAVAYLATGIAFAAIDSVWLKTMATRLYQPEIGELLADRFRLGPAIVFYLLYILGIMIVAVGPALRSGDWKVALVNGAAAVSGPHFSNWLDIYAAFTDAGGLAIVRTPDELTEAVLALLDDPSRRAAQAAAAERVVAGSAGAVSRTIEAIAPLIGGRPC